MAALPLNTAARQHVGAAVQRVLFSDLVSGVAKNLFTKLPNGTIPINIDIIQVVPFNSATTDVLDIGRAAGGNAAVPVAANANLYKNDVNLASAAGTKTGATLFPGVVNDASGGVQMTITWTGAGTAPTAGEFIAVMTFVQDGVETFTQG